MSEIRSQATPARDELAAYLDRVIDNEAWANTGAEAAKHIEEQLGWSKPRTVTSAAELKALPTCSLIRGLEREGQRSGDVFEKVGPDHWLCLDPGDRFDGEETTPSHAIVLIYKAGIRVLFTPGDAG